MASLSGKKVKDTYQGLIKTNNNSAVTSSNVELTDGNGNGIGVQVNTSGNVTASGAVTGNTIVKSGGTALQILLADGTVITLTRESDAISSNDSDSNIPSNAAVKDYVDTEITNLINSAPSNLDTLNELADALGDDANFSATVTTALGKRLRFDASQTLTSGELTQALTNLGITATVSEINFIDGVTSNIQTQINGLQSAITGGATTVTDSDLTASRALVSDSSGKISASDITSTEIGHLDNVSSNIQTQIDGKQATITGAATTIDDTDLTASKALISNASGKVAVSSVTDTELGHVSGVTSAIQTQINAKEDTITGGASSITSSDLTASKALESDSSGKVSASSVTSTELGYVSGVTSAIQTQLNAKQDTITGAATTIDDSDLTASRAVVSDASGKISVSNVTSAEILNLDGVTSNIQTQLDGKQATITGAATSVDDADLTADRAVVSNSSGKIAVSDVTSTEIGHLDGVSSNIQTQINGLQAEITGAAVTVTDVNLTANQVMVSSSTGKIATSDVTTTELSVLDGITASTSELNILDGVTSTTAELNILDGVTATASEINTLDGVTSTAAELNILDGVTATTSELNILDGVTSTTAELNILDGVTATTSELNHTDGVTSAIQDQLDGKQATITGAATSIDDADLTANRALLSDASGKVAVSAVTNTELGYLDGVTSNIQTQFNNLTDNNTTYTVSAVDSGDDAIIRLTDSDGSTDDVKLKAGSNITITPSGDDITIASTAAGGGSDISWQSSIKSANFTAVASEGYFVNTSSASITVTMPSSPSLGDIVNLIDYTGSSATNALVITSSDKILGGDLDKQVSTNFGSVQLLYSDSTYGWQLNYGEVAAGPILARALVVGGGGGGGYGRSGSGSSQNRGGGGGGAGEFLDKNNIKLQTGKAYRVVVGAGGAAATAGSNSQFKSNADQAGDFVFDFEVFGGGRGAGASSATNNGGGAGRARTAGGTASGNETSEGSLINDGGDGSNGSTTNTQAGGGGGAGAAGQNGNHSGNNHGGDGGDGFQSDITGTNTYYAGGGGGGINAPTGLTNSQLEAFRGQGGQGGGGRGGYNNFEAFTAFSVYGSTAGTDGLGGGGGGARAHTANGSAGGDGVVILKYPISLSITIGGGLTATTDSSSVSGFKITTFTAGTDDISFS